MGSDSAHGFAGGALALVSFAFEDEYVGAAGFGKMPRYAGADDASTDNDDVCSLHDGKSVIRAAG